MRHTMAIWITGAALVLVGCGQRAGITPTTVPTAPSVPTVQPTTVPPSATAAPLPTDPASPTAAPATATAAPATATVPVAAPTTRPTTPSTSVPSGRVTDTPAAVASPATGQSPIVNIVLRSLQALPSIGSKLSVQSVEGKEWSDSSLGCPDPAMMYLTVITPGYKIVLSDGATTYNIHTNNDGSRLVWCQAGKPVNVPRVP